MDSQNVLDVAYMILRDRGINRGSYAVDAHGNACPTAEAEQFCAAGAICRASMDLGVYGMTAHHEAIGRLQGQIIDEAKVIGHQWPSITTWNDRENDHTILSMMRRLATPTVETSEVALA